MIPKECKRLAEVDFPIAVVSKHSAREKSIRHGHPSTLHLWWARRPLAACRSMLLGLLLPDPCDPNCPAEFKTKGRKALLDAPGWGTERNKQQVKTDDGLRKALLTFIGDVANWDNANHPGWIGAARELVKAAHPEETPLVVDPFSGGGSIPLEALRLGCEAFASDLNPVACLILKVMLEDIPRETHRRGAEGAESLADELRRVGGEIKKQAEKELAEFYPKDPDGATPITYLWARTVRCESPNCGAEIPLVRSFWLCKKADRKRALQCIPVYSKGQPPHVDFQIFEPKTDKDVRAGTVSNAKATCLCCGAVLPGERVRSQLSEQRGGADAVFNGKCQRIGGARMLAVVTLRNTETGRHYRLPSHKDYQLVSAARKLSEKRKSEWGPTHPLNAPINPVRPSPNARGFSAVTRYGIDNIASLFTARQLLSVSSVSALIARQPPETVTYLLAFAVSKLADLGNALCRWEPMAECPRQLFTRHAAAIAWDFAEGVPISMASGSYHVCVENVKMGLGSLRTIDKCGTVSLADASSAPSR